MNILILCTGNSCRSQMAHGFLQSLDKRMQVASAGTNPTGVVNKLAIKVMKEIGIDISDHISKAFNKYMNKDWDYVITVCDSAKKSCPVFYGKVKHQLHIGFDDPSEGNKTVIEEFRRVRDEIVNSFNSFYINNIKRQIDNI